MYVRVKYLKVPAVKNKYYIKNTAAEYYVIWLAYKEEYKITLCNNYL